MEFLTSRPPTDEGHLPIIGTQHQRILRRLIETLVIAALAELAALDGQLVARLDWELGRIREILLLRRAADPGPLRPGNLLHLGRDDHPARPGTAALLLAAVGGAFGRARCPEPNLKIDGVYRCSA